MGLIEHRQIPLRDLLQPGLEIIVPRELTHTGDQRGPIREGIAQAGGVDQVAGEQLELLLELSLSSSCHCSVSERGDTTKQRSSSPRIKSSLISKSAMIVLPAPEFAVIVRYLIGWVQANDMMPL